MLGVGFPRYAVGVRAPSVWGGLLPTNRPARHFILFCFPLIHYIAFASENQEIFCLPPIPGTDRNAGRFFGCLPGA
jgi:hypothetical protein